MYQLIRTPNGDTVVIDRGDDLTTLALNEDEYQDADGALRITFIEREASWDCIYHHDEPLGIGCDPHDTAIETLHEWK